MRPFPIGSSHVNSRFQKVRALWPWALLDQLASLGDAQAWLIHQYRHSHGDLHIPSSFYVSNQVKLFLLNVSNSILKWVKIFPDSSALSEAIQKLHPPDGKEL